MKSIYTYYKERLIEISGKNRSLYSRKISKKYAYDIGKILDGDYDTINEFLEFTPVDCCAKAILKLSFNMDTNRYVFHIFNENYISVSELLKTLEKLGFTTSILAGNEFRQKIVTLSNEHSEQNILKGVVNDLDDTLGLSFNSTVNQKNIYTNNCLEKLDFKWPLINDEYIRKIIEYLRKKKYLD